MWTRMDDSMIWLVCIEFCILLQLYFLLQKSLRIQKNKNTWITDIKVCWVFSSFYFLLVLVQLTCKLNSYILVSNLLQKSLGLKVDSYDREFDKNEIGDLINRLRSPSSLLSRNLLEMCWIFCPSSVSGNLSSTRSQFYP